MKLTIYTEKELIKMGLKPIIKPTMNVIGVKIKNLNEVHKNLSKKGWKVNKIERISCLRIVLMPHITKKNIDEFLYKLKKV